MKHLLLPVAALQMAPPAVLHAAKPAKPGSERLVSPTGDAAHPGVRCGTPVGYSLWKVGLYR